MFSYHRSTLREERLKKGICRCGSTGLVHKLHELLVDGRIKDPQDLRANLTTPDVIRSYSDVQPLGSGIGRTFIFAVNENYEICVAPDGERASPNAVKHETLFHNADVRAAGEICIRNGIITNLNDLSGSYQTSGYLEAIPDFAASLLRAFQLHNLPVDKQLLEELGHAITI